MQIPRSVVINGKRWKVVRKPLGKLYFGRCYQHRREIHIDSESLPAEQEETFLHELLHACLPEPIPEGVEERIVLRLAPRLLEALKGLGWVR